MSSLYSKVTHVANGYDQDIWARVENDKGNVKGSLGGEIKVFDKVIANVKRETEREVLKMEGYTKIAPNEATKFYSSGDLDGRAYVSIYFASGEVLCTNHPIQVNRSVIVDANGSLKMAKYSIGPFGKSAIWTDEHGKCWLR